MWQLRTLELLFGTSCSCAMAKVARRENILITRSRLLQRTQVTPKLQNDSPTFNIYYSYYLHRKKIHLLDNFDSDGAHPNFTGKGWYY
jgi:hypothetical protein